MIGIRPETTSDYEAIEQVTIAAFAGKALSDADEHLIIRRLRQAGALSLSLVAAANQRIVGHIAFSVVKINRKDQGWYGLGPASVLPGLQKQGIGSMLIREGLTRIHDLGAMGCVLEGDPRYYQRFGFRSYPGLVYEGAPSATDFMALPFYQEVPNGKVEFHQAFDRPAHS
ncbi:MAG TPA: N-acetyltransferase [Anaerolineales bacterium]|nr:N-acetyltransferase [Anaerolineales bacterium]